jgi:GDP/UDP-N,N'-diacetylbacillosamine 2-epimerase (hydrolysing)
MIDKSIRSIALFSTSRSEFGLIKNLIHILKKNKKIKIYLFIGGSHFIKKYGNTISEIKKEKIKIDGFFAYGKNKDDEKSISKMLAKSTFLLSKIFSEFKFNNVMLFGDRHDLLPIIINSIIFRKVIFHVSGGETTEGAIDNQIRNIASKASHFHFTSAHEYSKKLISLGEKRENIYEVGSLSVDGIKKIKKTSKKRIIHTFKFNKNNPIVGLTYHPSILEKGELVSQKLDIIFKSLAKFKFNILITAPSLETGSNVVLKKIKSFCKKNKSWIFKNSLGFDHYQKFLMNCDFLIGNSSSGIIEAPFHKLPTINIGTRQKGRIRHANIIDVDYNEKRIINAIKLVLSNNFKKKIKNMKYKFGNGQAGIRISKIIAKNINNKKIIFKE